MKFGRSRCVQDTSHLSLVQRIQRYWLNPGLCGRVMAGERSLLAQRQGWLRDNGLWRPVLINEGPQPLLGECFRVALDSIHGPTVSHPGLTRRRFLFWECLRIWTRNIMTLETHGSVSGSWLGTPELSLHGLGLCLDKGIGRNFNGFGLVHGKALAASERCRLCKGVIWLRAP